MSNVSLRYDMDIVEHDQAPEGATGPSLVGGAETGLAKTEQLREVLSSLCSPFSYQFDPIRSCLEGDCIR